MNDHIYKSNGSGTRREKQRKIEQELREKRIAEKITTGEVKRIILPQSHFDKVLKEARSK